jgi:superfamily II DNA or RNA helicase
VSTAAGLREHDVEAVLDDGILYYRDTLDREQVVDRLTTALGVPLPASMLAETLRATERESRRQRVEAIGVCATLAEKLVAAVGLEGLRATLPLHVIEAAEVAEGSLVGSQLALLNLAIHGVSVLKVLRAALASALLDPPRQWNGGNRAITFVRELGFPDSYAGMPASAVPPWLEVQGPVVLNPLHAFQGEISETIQQFLSRPQPGRGMLSLPTGAGKTRVVTESIVRSFADDELHGCVLWIADRQELCEQAVQTWKEVWRAFGPRDSLRISRFWGGTNRDVVGLGSKPHLVVATYQTLSRRLTPDFDWLADAELIVIDEAHGSTAPSYTEILTWLGLDQYKTDRPLIGLSATPFRGRRDDDDQTRRLVNRFDGARFDRGVFPDEDPFPLLRQLGVLSQVDWETLPGSEIRLTRSELEHLGVFKVLPASAEGKLGLEPLRNFAITQAVERLPPDWPILLFATSVDHAEILAGLLALRGISAAAISSRTPDDARRHAIEEFRAKRTQVLTNYGVLTTGFDAPETRAIFVTRPVYTPGLYQQMIGRGLRGPANGGTEKCLIVNISDNVLEYGEELAFRHFEYLWR